MVCGHTPQAIWAAAKGAGTLLSLTDFDEVKAHVGQELGVSDRHLVGRLRCACCPSASA
jgi:hypothetical protein